MLEAFQDSSNDQPASVWWTCECAYVRAHLCVHACAYMCVDQQPNIRSQHGVKSPRDTTAHPRLVQPYC